MDLNSVVIWVLGAIGLGFLVAQFLVFVLIIYALDNRKIDLANVAGLRARAANVMNLIFGFGFGFLVLSSLLVSASRKFLEGLDDLVPLVFVGSSFLFFILIVLILKVFK